MLTRILDWRGSIAWADIVILGSNDLPMMEIERRCQERGVPLIGGGPESAKWENDRLHGMSIFKRVGIAIPPVREFTDYDTAIAYVESLGEPVYSKPCWPDADKALSCKTGVDEDPAFMLKRFKWQHQRPKGKFILQDAVKGIEFAVGGWFGPSGFATGWEENFEFKRLFSGDVGPNTGEMGTVMRLVSKSKLADKVLSPIADMLDRTGFCGNIDVGTIIDEYGDVYPLEFTVRCGWPSTNIEQDLYDGDFIEFLAGLAEGHPPRNARRMDEVAVGIVLALPPFPFPITDYDQVVGWPIYGITPSIEDRVHFAQAMIDKDRLMTAGDYVAICTGTGDTIQAARGQAYRTVDRLSLPATPYWRDDIGQRLARDLDRLQTHGFAKGMEYA